MVGSRNLAHHGVPRLLDHPFDTTTTAHAAVRLTLPWGFPNRDGRRKEALDDGPGHGQEDAGGQQTKRDIVPTETFQRMTQCRQSSYTHGC